jgi:hypothetical protein
MGDWDNSAAAWCAILAWVCIAHNALEVSLSTPSGDDQPPLVAISSAPTIGEPAAPPDVETLAAVAVHGTRPRPIEPAHARSDLYFKRFLGFLAIAFPFMLLLGRMLLDGVGMEDSISDYYYTRSMRNLLVGGLVALAILLICYRYARVDDTASTIAGLCAIGVAIFPTAPSSRVPTPREMTTGTAHYAFAATFFLILAFYAIFIFTEPFAPFHGFRRFMWRVLFRHFGVTAPRTPSHYPTRRKRQRNGIYLACGGLIIACIMLLLISRIFHIGLPAPLHYVFWLETLAVCAFGFAWVVKGEVLLKDQEDPEPDLIQHYYRKFRALLPAAKRAGG